MAAAAEIQDIGQAGSRPCLGAQAFLDLPLFSAVVLDFLAAQTLLRSSAVAQGWSVNVQATLARRHASRPLFTFGGLLAERGEWTGQGEGEESGEFVSYAERFEGGYCFTASLRHVDFVPDTCVIFTTSRTQLCLDVCSKKGSKMIIGRLPPQCLVVVCECDGVIGPDLESQDRRTAAELFYDPANHLPAHGSSFMLLRAGTGSPLISLFTGMGTSSWGWPAEADPDHGRAEGVENTAKIDQWLDNVAPTPGSMTLVLVNEDGNSWTDNLNESLNQEGSKNCVAVGGIVSRVYASRLESMLKPAASQALREVEAAVLTIPSAAPRDDQPMGTASRAAVVGDLLPATDHAPAQWYEVGARKTFAAAGVTEPTGFAPQAGFVVTCVERGPELHSGIVGVEAAAHEKIFGKHVPLVGFYAGGELGPKAETNLGVQFYGYSSVVGIIGNGTGIFGAPATPSTGRYRDREHNLVS